MKRAEAARNETEDEAEEEELPETEMIGSSPAHGGDLQDGLRAWRPPTPPC